MMAAIKKNATSKAKPQRTFLGRPVDYNAGHTPGWAAFNGTSSTAVAGTAAYMAHMPPIYGLGLGAVAVATGLIAGKFRRLVGGHLLYRTIVLAAGAGWISWSASHDPWGSWMPGAALAAGGLLAWSGNTGIAEHEINATERRRVVVSQRRRNNIGDEWEDRIKRVAGLECRITAVEDWASGAGLTLAAEFPEGGKGHVFTEVKRYEEALAADARLPHGAGVEVIAGHHRGAFQVRVATKDVMADLIPIPADVSPLTINNPFDIGLLRDGSEALAGMRFVCGLLTGQTDAGKTNTLNVINHQVGRCVDALIWHIDVTGAGISLPWLRAWALDGTANRPVIDWTAPTVEEADAMLTMAIEIIGARKTGYQDLMHKVNDDKVPVSAQLPEIIIIADEVKELPYRIQEKLDSVIDTGRASGVRSLNCALRATGDTITSAMKKQTRLRIGMRAMDPEEYSYLFAGYQRIDPANAPYSGSGFIAFDRTTPSPFKAYRITPSDITSRSAALGNLRPELDQLSARVPSGSAYASRWARTLPLLFPQAQLAPAAVAARDAVPAAARTAAGGFNVPGPNADDAIGPWPPVAGAEQPPRQRRPQSSLQERRQRFEEERWKTRPDGTEPPSNGWPRVLSNEEDRALSSIPAPLDMNDQPAWDEYLQLREAHKAWKESLGDVYRLPPGDINRPSDLLAWYAEFKRTGVAPPVPRPAEAADGGFAGGGHPDAAAAQTGATDQTVLNEHGVGPTPQAGNANANAPEARERALALLLGAARDGVGATQLTKTLGNEGYPTNRQTVQSWLTRWAAEGRVVRRKGDEDRYPVYVHDRFAD